MKKKCNKCGKEVPEDSSFCQHCGSNDIIDLSEVNKTRCKKCGRELPDDSEFCQYCGSDDIEKKMSQKDEKEALKTNDKKAINTGDTSAISNFYKSSSNIDNSKTKKYKTVAIISSIAATILLFFAIGYYNSYFGMNSQYQNLLKMYNTTSDEKDGLETKVNKLETKAENYEDIISYAKKANAYSDFFTKKTILYKPKNESVPIYFGHYNSNVWYQTSSSNVTADWSNQWNGFWTTLNITYTGSGVEYVKIYNDANNEEFYIVLIGS